MDEGLKKARDELKKAKAEMAAAAEADINGNKLR